jgi:hypothetical protein
MGGNGGTRRLWRSSIWHLRHCLHHDPTSILACLLIKLLAFNLFLAFALLNGKLYRQGKITLQELRLQLYRAC